MRTFTWLVDRIRRAQGVPFGELAAAHGIVWPDDPRRRKGLSGRIVESVLGVAQNPSPEPDLTDLGVEIKTVPLGRGLRPREDTKIAALNYAAVAAEPWERSHVRDKLNVVLFVPIVKLADDPHDWYMRTAFIWMPSVAARSQLRSDYEAIRAEIVAGRADTLTSARPPKGFGVFLTARTSGRDRHDTVRFELAERAYTTKRRAWFLRRDVVERILVENASYRP